MKDETNVRTERWMIFEALVVDFVPAIEALTERAFADPLKRWQT